MNISKSIITWYKKNKRDLPWRNTKDPYIIWVSEIVLQQTRVDQGMGYFNRFIERFPDIQSLASAPIDEVLKIWQGLGYYTRARNMHFTANHIVNTLNGHFPDNYNALVKLKGVGDYTAAAIASFAFEEPVVVNDGNVTRVLSRLYGINKPINTSAGKTEIITIARKLIDHKSPGIFNQAIMEFGALHCTPRNPKCPSCPFNRSCVAYKANETSQYPVKNKKATPRKRYFFYLVIEHNHQIYFHKRDEKDIWHSLYEFPLIESNQPLKNNDLQKSEQWQAIFAHAKYNIINISASFKHQLTHQTIDAKFFFIKLSEKTTSIDKSYLAIAPNDIKSLPIPRLIDRYIKSAETKKYFNKLL